MHHAPTLKDTRGRAITTLIRKSDRARAIGDVGEAENLMELVTALLDRTVVDPWAIRAPAVGAARWLPSPEIDTPDHSADLPSCLATYRTTPRGQWVQASEGLARLNGYERAADLIEAVRDINTECYVKLERRREFQALLVRHGRIWNFESEVYRHRTGERIWIREDARLILDLDTGEPVHYLGTVCEIPGPSVS